MKQQAHKKSQDSRWTVFIDGASRGNPGTAGIGIYVLDESKKVIIKEGFYVGKNITNNQAEYLALMFALLLLQKKLPETSIPFITFISDSELLIRQMNGLYKIKNQTLAYLKSLIDSMLTNLVYEFKHVMREHNAMADSLANYGLDKKRMLSEPLVTFLREHNLISSR